MAALPAAHHVHVDEHRHPSAFGIHRALEFWRVLVDQTTDIFVVDRPPPSVEVVHDSVGAVAVDEGNPRVARDSLKERCCRVPHPDGQLVGPVYLSGAEEGEVRLALAIDARRHHWASISQCRGEAVPQVIGQVDHAGILVRSAGGLPQQLEPVFDATARSQPKAIGYSPNIIADHARAQGADWATYAGDV